MATQEPRAKTLNNGNSTRDSAHSWYATTGMAAERSTVDGTHK